MCMCMCMRLRMRVFVCVCVYALDTSSHTLSLSSACVCATKKIKYFSSYLEYERCKKKATNLVSLEPLRDGGADVPTLKCLALTEQECRLYKNLAPCMCVCVYVRMCACVYVGMCVRVCCVVYT